MAQKKTRAEHKAETRRALLEAGAALFAKEGLDAPSLDAICERAGYTRGAFYVHFESRDDFLAAVMEHAGTPVLDRILSSGQDDDLGAIFGRFVRAFADGSYPLGPGGGIKPHQLLEACARSPRVRERYVALITDSIERLRRGIGRAQNAGILRGDLDPHTLGAVILAATIGAQAMAELDVPFVLADNAAALLVMLSAPPK